MNYASLIHRVQITEREVNIMKHYHVLLGLHGCMPDSNETYLCKADARDAMLWHKNEITEDWYTIPKECEAPKPTFSGSARSGHYEVDNVRGVHYIEIIECWEEDCLEHESMPY